MDFVIIANDWAAGVNNPTSKHRIAIELAARGHRILWFEGSGMRQPALSSGSDRSRITAKLKKVMRPPQPSKETEMLPGKISVVSPFLIPLPSKGWVRRFNGLACVQTARFWGAKAGFKDPVLINYVPTLAEAMRFWPGKRIYHCVDRWDAFSTYDSELMAAMDASCCRYAQAVIASSEDLAERCRRHSQNVTLVTHGVDYAHFAAAPGSARPADLPSGNVIGFFGLVSEWLDQELIVKMARALPDNPVVLIGKPDVDTTGLSRVSNLHLMGPRPFRDLPGYVGNFGVGIIPFAINELTIAVNPIKLREMLAAGCPVVSTALPEVARLNGLAGAVDIARSHDEFIDFVKQRMGSPMPIEKQRAVSDEMKSETWAGKVDEILQVAARI